MKWFYIYGSHETKPMVLKTFNNHEDAKKFLVEKINWADPFDKSNHWIEDEVAVKERFKGDDSLQQTNH